MSEPYAPGPSPRVLRAEAVDNVCDAFERAWLVDQTPRIEHYLEAVDKSDRAELLEELLISELCLQIGSGIAPDRAQYVKRFPACAELIDRLIRETGEDGKSPSRPGTRSGSAATRTSGSLTVRCPHCRCPVDVIVEARLDAITCSECGRQFSLVDEATDNRSARTLKRLGHFELIDRLGLGGFGTVWKARDTELDRTVALKIPRRGQFEPAEIDKFLREARAAAQLKHPNIVTVHEVGRGDDTVYIVSDLVHGVSLSDWLSDYQPNAREAANLCAQIADALHHAHEAGVIHRDLKPQNIMMDTDDVPHLTDFGLARRDAGETTMTMDGHVLGTPAYMSPEQARGEAHRADRRTDIYSLGVILFKLLTGELPFRGNARMLIHQVLNDEPPIPRNLSGNVPRDLETICLKCLEKEPANRYQTAHDVSAELQRFCRREPINARPIGQLARGWRWCRRNPVVAALAGLLGIVLVILSIVGPLVAIGQSQLARDMTKLAEQREAEIHVSTVTRLAAESRGNHNELPIRSVLLAIEAVELDRRKTSSVSPIAHEALLNATVSLGGIPLTQEGREARWLAASPDGKWFATQESGNSILLWNFEAKSPLASAIKLKAPSRASLAKFSPDGRSLVVVTSNGGLVTWNLDGALSRVPNRVYDGLGPIVSLAVSSDGRWLACITEDEALRLFDLRAEDPIESIREVRSVDLDADSSATEHTDHAMHADQYGRDYLDRASAVRISADNRWVIARESRDDLELKLWKLSEQEPISEPLTIQLDSEDEGPCTSILIQERQNRLYVGTALGKVRGFDLNVDDPTKQFFRLNIKQQHSAVLQMASDVSGKRFAAAREGLHVWDSPDDTRSQNPRVWYGHDGSAISVAMSADARWLVTGGVDGKVRLWDLESDDPSHEQRVLTGHEQRVIRVWISYDGTWVVSASLGGVPRVWDCRDHGTSLYPFQLRAGVNSHSTARKRVFMALSRDGRWLATGDENGTVRLWRMTLAGPERISGSTLHHTGSVQSIAISPDDSWLITGGIDDARLSKLSDRHEPRTFPLNTNGEIRTVAISPDNRWASTGSTDGTVVVWDLTAADTPAACKEFRGHRGKLKTSAISQDSRWLATACSVGDVFVWDSESPGAEPVSLNAHRGQVAHMAISDDARYLATASTDKKVIVWQLGGAEPKPVHTIRFSGPIYSVTISPNGRWVAAHEYWTHRIELIDLHSTHERQLVLPAKHGAQSMAVSSDNRWLAIGTSKNSAMLWDLEAEDISASRRVLRGHQGRLWSIAFSPSADWLYTADDSGKVILWPLEVEDLLERARRTAGRSLTTDERKQYGLHLRRSNDERNAI